MKSTDDKVNAGFIAAIRMAAEFNGSPNERLLCIGGALTGLLFVVPESLREELLASAVALIERVGKDR